MPYQLFLLYTGVFVAIGILAGIVLLWIGSRYRVSLRSLATPLTARHRPRLVHRVPLNSDTTN